MPVSTPFRLIIFTLALISLSTTAIAQTQASCTFKLFDLPEFTAVPRGVNDAGTVVGVAPNDQASGQGFIRTATGKVMYYCAPGANCTVYNSSTYFTGRNDAGVSVGVYNKVNSEQEGFMLQASTFTTIQAPDTVYGTFPNALNKSNTVVGYYLDSATNSHGFQRTSEGAYTTLDYPEAQETWPAGINDDGVIVGSYYPGHAFIYQDGTWATVAYPGASATALVGISNTGVMIGNKNTTNPDIISGFLYEEGAFKLIVVPNSYSTTVNAMSADGLILGMTTLNSTGTEVRGFTATCK